ncbi:LON peptidase substrate-binding domain-containing protein [Loktanella sp. SALINAS62]|uniref:LON peptidase substrate-binding domain-containing protein n=1 Tax=Loktanella sp. SALINAS62 TaxID=2706124 RepID=UPI001B8D7744|nr:LON peptidase substrate-binding domain-containing protein [Loktanella sp. SALINAS62]MBS1301827.1 ATP-dependent protease [Loktanella sp. SALINAS62]
MISSSDLPETIPIFPLPGALLLPRGRMPLHIFEPRYLAMVEDAMKSPLRLIGMVQPYDTPGKQSRLHSIGCAGRLNAFNETEDGRYMITLSGISRFRVTREVEGFQPYRRCDVKWDGFERDLGPVERDHDFDRDVFMDMLGRYFDDQGLKTDWDQLGDAEDELLINSLSMLCPFPPEDKQALLEAPSLSTRRETLVTLIEYALRGGSEDMMQ